MGPSATSTRLARAMATKARVMWPTASAAPRALFDDADAVETARDGDDAIAATQLGAASDAVVAVAARCAHGAPRAYVFAPTSAGADGAVRAEHGTCRLACPALRDETTRVEREGGLRDVARAVDASETLMEGLVRAHEDAPRIRRWLLGDAATRRLRNDAARDGPESDAGRADFIVNHTGLVGVTLRDVRRAKTWKIVKCLHAHLADFLVRGRGKNPVGGLVYDSLVERGFPVNGTETCARRCGL